MHCDYTVMNLTLSLISNDNLFTETHGEAEP